MKITVRCINSFLGETGEPPFWVGDASEIQSIRNSSARELAQEVIKDGKTRKSGMWTVSGDEVAK